MPINAVQCRSSSLWSSIDRHWSVLRSIDHYWSSLIGIDLYWDTFLVNARNLIRHWSVLIGIDHWYSMSCLIIVNEHTCALLKIRKLGKSQQFLGFSWVVVDWTLDIFQPKYGSLFQNPFYVVVTKIVWRVQYQTTFLTKVWGWIRCAYYREYCIYFRWFPQVWVSSDEIQCQCRPTHFPECAV